MSDRAPFETEKFAHALASRPATGLGITLLRGAQAVALARQHGYEWLFIDLEHGALSIADAAEICLGAACAGLTPFVRCRHEDLSTAARLLDNGCGGIVVPKVQSEQEARAIVRALRIPPLGIRGMGGSGLGRARGALASADSRTTLDRELLIAVTIEDPEGLSNIDRIAAVQGVDILLLGATDLSFEYGIGGKTDDSLIRVAAARIADACRAHHRIFGVGGFHSPAQIAECVAQGARLILAGMDHAMLATAAADRIASIRGACEAAAGAAISDP